MVRKTWAVLALSAAIGAVLVAAPAPVQAAPVAGIDWTAAGPPPAHKRVIEVVDKVPSAWRVNVAVNWLDRYTASDMRLVRKCTGKAYRCIIVKVGRVGGAPVGWSEGRYITIDTSKANGKLRKYYRHRGNRDWLLIHELGHQHGLGHSSGRNAMNPYVDRYKLVLTKGQRLALKSR